MKDGKVYAMIGVKDIDAAKHFYGQTLGLNQLDDNAGGVMYGEGDAKVFVYQTPNAGTNQSTAASWDVKNVKQVVDDLKNSGIEFEHYEFPGVEYDGDVHIMGGMKAAWFKDPDGNILQVIEA